MDAPSVRSSMPADKPSVPSSTAAPEGSVPLSDLRASAQPTNPSTGINEGITTGVTDTPSAVSVPPTSPVRASAQPIYLSTTNIPSSGTHIASPGDSSDVTAADPAPDLGRLSLRPQTVHSSPEPVVQHPSRSEPSRVRSHEEAFSRFRDATSAASSAVSSKRVRADVNVPTAPRGIQIHPAHSPEWEDTPRGYTNEFAHLHPWGRFVKPRPPVPAITEESVTRILPLHVYRQIPQDGYFASRFVRSLFPRRFRGTPSPSNPLPILEIPRLRDIIAFRQQAVQLTTALLADTYESDQEAIRQLPLTPGGDVPTRLCPPTRNGIRPVLYQVVHRSYGQGAIVEAKDFFIPGPDLRELHCLPLTQDSVNFLTGTRGFMRDQLSVKDFVWVLSLRPTLKTLASTDRQEVLRQSRLPRPSVIESQAPYFFRVHEFILVTPAPLEHQILGIVIEAQRRRYNFDHVNNILVAFQGCHDAVRVSRRICNFCLSEVDRDTLLRATARTNVSCAMRFSHWAVSRSAQRFLVNAARRFLPAHPDEGMLPLRVFRLTDADLRWVRDREQGFLNYSRNPEKAKRRMGKLFAVASAALAAQSFGNDDKTTHETTAFVPSLSAIPVRLQLSLDAMQSEGGWSRSRRVSTWVIGSTTLVRTTVASSQFRSSQSTVEIELHSSTHHHQSLVNAIRRFGAVDEKDNSARVPVCVRLCRESTGADPVFDILASESPLTSLGSFSAPSLARTVLDAVYSSQPRSSHAHMVHPSRLQPMSIRVGDSTLRLRNDQTMAVQLGTEDHPILAIQAACGTGKTLVAAVIAARLASAGNLVLVTATTNVAIAQFTETLLKLEDYPALRILRFLSDTALKEGAPTTRVDLHHVLKGLLASFSNSLSDEETEQLTRYRHGRELIERLLLQPQTTTSLTDEEREEFRIAENQNSEATEEAVRIMLRVRFPSIVCITTASLLNTTRPGGLFPDVLSTSKVIIGDEASQIPEPAFVALLGRFTLAKHIYIGDVNQLEPHIRCPRSSLPARLGAKGVMELLMSKEIPLARLVTTFRSHPALNDLPNRLIYDGALVSGISARQRQMLTRRLNLPNPTLPFVFVDVPGRSRLSPSKSHYNEQEAKCCQDLIFALLATEISASSIAVITFYKEQQRLLEACAARHRVQLHTVDSVQGREMDIVIILTTRTMVDPDSGEFLDDRKRLNVAITRCRHGLFILGNVRALCTLHHWGALLQYAHEHRAIIGASQLPDIFA